MFTIKYNRNTNHIDGLDIRSAGTEMDYAKSSCPTLSRNGYALATGRKLDTVEEALKAVRSSQRATGRKACRHCVAAAEAMI
jgi:hypothetical protein